MPNFAEYNKPVVEFLEGALGAMPGRKRRMNGELIRRQMFGILGDAHDGLDLLSQAEANNQLAATMNRLGYGNEAVLFADRSMGLDRNKQFVIGNLGVKAYAEGMIKGNFEKGLILFAEQLGVMEALHVADDTARIKSYQNRGQIYHRVGMHYPQYFEAAIRHYVLAQKILDNNPHLDDDPKKQAEKELQFRGQLGYCYAKSLARLALVDTANAAKHAKDARTQIDAGLAYIATKDKFDFERACFKAVEGLVLAVEGRMEESLAMLNEALAEQVRHGPTLAPRHASTMAKINSMLGANQISPVEFRRPLEMLAAFYGDAGHPDLAFYGQSLLFQKTLGVPKPFKFEMR